MWTTTLGGTTEQGPIQGLVQGDKVLFNVKFVQGGVAVTLWAPGATALSTQQSMSDRTLTLDGTTAKLRGTFPPGESTVEYQWQVPYGETASVDLTIGMPPHVAVARAMAIAGPGNTLVVDGWLESLDRTRFWCAFEVRRTSDSSVMVRSRQMLALVQMPAGRPVRLPQEWADQYKHLVKTGSAGAKPVEAS
jgi:hypothetical protein